MRVGPYLLFPVAVDKCGILDRLPSQEPICKFKRISGDICKDRRSSDIRIMSNKRGNFSVSASCKQQKVS